MDINKKIDELKGKVGYLFYTRIYTPIKAWQIRHKKQINVLFVVSEVGVWKTENLYISMLAHPRFNPMIHVVRSMENDRAWEEVQAYMASRGYTYINVESDEPLQKEFKADIIFYQKPYIWTVPDKQKFTKNKNALFAFANYAFHNAYSEFLTNQPFHNYAWQLYYENESSARENEELMDNRGRNIKVTGLPMSDSLLMPPSSDPWKRTTIPKKRIIWAPHHTIPQFGRALAYSTFMDYADTMLEIARKYSDRVQFAFKPHPLLQPKLRHIWGDDRTDKYYEEWATMENSQLELGAYTDLFKTSDALIHDCGSFTIEYHYTQNPVLYLESGGHDDTPLVSYAQTAYDLHYKAHGVKDIEQFIQMIVDGVDPLKEKRNTFFNEELMPPNGMSACDNIMIAILKR